MTFCSKVAAAAATSTHDRLREQRIAHSPILSDQANATEAATVAATIEVRSRARGRAREINVPTRARALICARKPTNTRALKQARARVSQKRALAFFLLTASTNTRQPTQTTTTTTWIAIVDRHGRSAAILRPQSQKNMAAAFFLLLGRRHLLLWRHRRRKFAIKIIDCIEFETLEYATIELKVEFGLLSRFSIGNLHLGSRWLQKPMQTATIDDPMQSAKRRDQQEGKNTKKSA